MDKKQIVYRRFLNSGLINKFESAYQVADQLCGVQAQYFNHGLFNIYNRVNELTGQRYSVLFENNLILAWGQRNTLHIYTKDNWLNINRLLSQETWVPQYFRQKGIDLKHESEQLIHLVGYQIEISNLKKIYQDRWASIFNWSALFVELSRQGKLFLIFNDKGNKLVEINYNKVNDSQHLVDLAYQYFKYYGPATLNDLAHFYGTTQSFWQAHFPNNLVSCEVNKEKFYYVDDKITLEDFPEVILLGKFDPLLLAYKNKQILIPSIYHKKVWGSAGQVSAVITNEIENNITQQFVTFAQWMGIVKVNFTVKNLKNK